MYSYHPKFGYGTHTTHGQKVYFYIIFLNTFLSSRVLDYFAYSASRNIQYFPCLRIFRVFRIFEYSVCSVILLRRSTIPLIESPHVSGNMAANYDGNRKLHHSQKT